MAAQQTPGEFAREIFEYDVDVMRQLVFRDDVEVIRYSLSPIAIEIANQLNYSNEICTSAESTVLALYMLDDNKRTTLQLLEGVN
jgi:hypothetical protein